MSGDLDDLNRKLEAFKAGQDKAPDPAKAADAQSMNMGVRAGTELVGCIGAGGFIGWLLDKWLLTSPLCLIIFLLLGMAAAFLNIYKITMGMGTSVGFAPLHNGEKKARNPANKKESE